MEQQRDNQHRNTWRALDGESMDSVHIGAHVIDVMSGRRGQVEQVLGPRSALVRMDDDGSLQHAGPYSATP